MISIILPLTRMYGIRRVTKYTSTLEIVGWEFGPHTHRDFFVTLLRMSEKNIEQKVLAHDRANIDGRTSSTKVIDKESKG